jgi:sialidase-1
MTRSQEANMRERYHSTAVALLALSLFSFGCAHSPVSAASAPAAEEKPMLVDVYTRGVDGYPNYRIPAILLTNRGTLLAFAEARQGGDHSENDIVVRRSTDGGKTWAKMHVIAEMGGDSLNDPCAVVAGETGRILLVYERYPQGYHTRKMKHTEMAELGYGGPRNTQTFLTHSDDDGVTWSEPRDVTRAFRRPDAISVGSPGIGIQLTRGPHRGRVLIPLYEVTGEDTDDRARSCHNCAAYSDDGGETWQLGERVPHGDLESWANEAQIAELPDGGVLMNARSQGGESVRKSAISRDGGKTWSTMRVDPGLQITPCMGSIVRHSWPKDGAPADVAPADGRSRLVLSVPNSPDKRVNGCAFVSTDEGKTWNEQHVIYPGGFAYSCLVVMPDGRIGCLFERDGYHHISFTVFGVK